MTGITPTMEAGVGHTVRDFQIKKCPKTDAEILSLCTLCLCGSFLRIIYFLEVSYCLIRKGGILDRLLVDSDHEKFRK